MDVYAISWLFECLFVFLFLQPVKIPLNFWPLFSGVVFIDKLDLVGNCEFFRLESPLCHCM